MDFSTFNLVDVALVIALIIYVYAHIGAGVFQLVSRLVAFVGGAVLAFVFYEKLSEFASLYIEQVSIGVLDAISFLVLFAVIQYGISWLLGIIIARIHLEWQQSLPSKILGIAPALLDGAILASLILLLLVTVPVFPQVKPLVDDSRIGSALVDRAAKFESYGTQIFGDAAREVEFLTVHPEEGESVSLPFKPKRTSIDEEAEKEMIVLVNIERAKVGAGPLVMDVTIVPVARAHSLDMWMRQYFAHENPDGESPFDRMEEGGVKFQAAGENLALARSLDQAHVGLMNSPGHKRNILDPVYTRVGIGVIDGGIYGKMFTQNFAK